MTVTAVDRPAQRLQHHGTETHEGTTHGTKHAHNGQKNGMLGASRRQQAQLQVHADAEPCRMKHIPLPLHARCALAATGGREKVVKLSIKDEFAIIISNPLADAALIEKGCL